MKTFFLSLLLVVSIKIGFCQSFIKTDIGISCKINQLQFEVQFYTSSIVRILKYPENITPNKSSYSVIMQPKKVDFKVEEFEGLIKIETDSLLLKINTQTGRVIFLKRNGILLLTEKDESTLFTPIKEADKNAFAVRQAFKLEKDEAIYGLGQIQNGRLSQRNQKVLLRQDNMKVSIPFFQSIKGYGVFWDNYSPTIFSDNILETSFDSEVGYCSDYYFLCGNNCDGVNAQMRILTGQAPLMPLWVFGFNQSRERYKTQNELLGVVKEYRDLKIPLDGIIQDWQYWGKDTLWNAMKFDTSTYPNPQLMIDSIHKMNAHLFIVAWPGFGPKTEQYKEFKQKNMLIDFETWPPSNGTRPYDPYNPIARDIYWQHLNKGVFSLNPDAWWLDSSEPDHVNLKEKDFDLPTFAGTLRTVRNAFPLLHVGGVYEHQRAATNTKRVTILTRSAFAGQQRYGANTWSGDVVSNWSTFRTQISAGLNFSLTGIPYWNTDIGGFFASKFKRNGGAKNSEFQELYTRWLQFATFTPMMRSHGTDIPREIYQFGQRGDTIFDVQEKFIKLRYNLLPYLYSTAWQVTHHSGSFIRALVMDFPKDTSVHNIDNQFLLGNSILVTPVTEKGIQMQSVYLPTGTKWFDFWTGEQIDGGKTIQKKVPISIMPVYVKSGSIIPWGPNVQFAEEKKWSDLEIRVYAGKNAQFTLYEDENDNYNYEKGMYATIEFKWNEAERKLIIDDVSGSFSGMLKTRKFNIVIVNEQNGIGTTLSTKIDKSVIFKGKKMEIKF